MIARVVQPVAGLLPRSRSRGSSGRALLLSVTAALLLGACRTTFPPELTATFQTRTQVADEFFVPVPVPHRLAVSAWFGNSAAARFVQIEWSIRHGQAEPAAGDVREAVSFWPVALCRRAGSTNQFFVAGWTERGSTLIIERWELSVPELIGVTIHPVTGEELTLPYQPEITRSIVAVLPGMPPLAGMACHPFAGQDGQLLLMEHGEEYAVWALDLASGALVDGDGDGSPDPLWTTTSQPLLIGKHSLRARFVTGGGFFLLFDVPYRWGDGRASHPLVLQDIDLDGLVDATLPMTNAEFMQAWPYAQWDPRYSGP